MVDTSAVPDYTQMARLDGRGFIVAGGGQGMGRQAAHALAQHGARVVVLDYSEELAQAVAAEVDGIPYTADVRRAGDVAGAVETAVRELGRLHGVVDVIGMARWAALVDMPEEDWDWCHDMVLRHAYHFAKYAGRAIADGGGGSMVFVASVDGVSSAPFHAAYGAAKAGLISLVRTAAVELKPHEVRVNVIAPGGVATPRLLAAQGLDSPEAIADGSLGKLARTEDIAAALLFMSCDMSRHITGQYLAVDGGDLVKSPYDITEPPVPPGAAMGEPGSEWKSVI